MEEIQGDVVWWTILLKQVYLVYNFITIFLVDSPTKLQSGGGALTLLTF